MWLRALLLVAAAILPPAAPSNATALPPSCRYLFLDVGANVGLHTRYLFEPQLYPQNRYHARVFDAYFPLLKTRALRRHHASEACAVLFEASERHAPRLGDLARAYTKRGWSTRSYAGVAVGATSGGDEKTYRTFYRKNSAQEAAKNEWGYSSFGLQAPRANTSGQWTAERVEVLDLSAFIKASVPSDGSVVVVMKMDIEVG